MKMAPLSWLLISSLSLLEFSGIVELGSDTSDSDAFDYDDKNKNKSSIREISNIFWVILKEQTFWKGLKDSFSCPPCYN
jgi:hypothetical protein